MIIDDIGVAISPIRLWKPNQEDDEEDTLRSLHQCALVCRRWRARAQMWAFRKVTIHNMTSLRRLSYVLAAAPPLASHIRFVQLSCGSESYDFRGGTFPSHNVAIRFPSIFTSRLMSLRSIALVGYRNTEHPAARYGMPYLPFPPRASPGYFATYATVAELSLYRIKFAAFPDFAKLLSCFLCLEELSCSRVAWSILGLLPACMARQPSRSRKQPLGRLRKLTVCILYRARNDNSCSPYP